MREDADPPRYEVPAISLRLRHPDPRDLASLLSSWGLSVGRSWRAGDARTAAHGRELEGRWPGSYAYARLKLANASTLSIELSNILKSLAGARAELVDFVDHGGSAELFVFWRFFANSGGAFDWTLLSALADYRLNLSLDIYPDGDGSDPQHLVSAAQPATGG